MEQAQNSVNNQSISMVMLVDDDPLVAEALRQMVDGEEDIEFHYCASPEKAMEIAEHVNPTVILLDMVMPDIDGLTLLRYLRANTLTAQIPIVALSMQEEPELKAKVFSNGGNDYLVKLPDRIEVLARIRYHSLSYVHLLQRDEAYRALRVSQKQLSETNLQLQKLATMDGLTGIANRRQIDDALLLAWRRAARNEEWLTLIMIDIDYFKSCNDHYGHQYGDDVLRRVAQCLEQSLHRPADIVARYGGEEFIVLLPETDIEGGKKIAETLRYRVEGLQIEHDKSDVSKHVTISAGVGTTVPENNIDPGSLIKLADRAMYDAKEQGRNRVIVSPVMKI